MSLPGWIWIWACWRCDYDLWLFIMPPHPLYHPHESQELDPNVQRLVWISYLKPGAQIKESTYMQKKKIRSKHIFLCASQSAWNVWLPVSSLPTPWINVQIRRNGGGFPSLHHQITEPSHELWRQKGELYWLQVWNEGWKKSSFWLLELIIKDEFYSAQH